MPARIESLLSARLFVAPQLVDERIYFISNLSGHLSLYAINYGGSVPEPLLPPHLALQNPHLIGGYSFYALHDLGNIVVMLDRDGDENYQPMLIPLEGGFPEPAFDNFFAGYRVHLTNVDAENRDSVLQRRTARQVHQRSLARQPVHRRTDQTGRIGLGRIPLSPQPRPQAGDSLGRLFSRRQRPLPGGRQEEKTAIRQAAGKTQTGRNHPVERHWLNPFRAFRQGAATHLGPVRGHLLPRLPGSRQTRRNPAGQGARHGA
jgi:hypothetical protein